MECKNCDSEMRIKDKRKVMVELDEDATEGQEADYLQAELSGDFGDWGATEITYHCNNCKLELIVVEI